MSPKPPPLHPHSGDELLTTHHTLPQPPNSQTMSDYLLDIEKFLTSASPPDFHLYVLHCRAMLAHPEHCTKPRLFLGMPTGPNTNQLIATGDRVFALAAIKQCRAEYLAALGKGDSRLEEGAGELVAFGGNGDDKAMGKGRKCVVM